MKNNVFDFISILFPFIIFSSAIYNSINSDHILSVSLLSSSFIEKLIKKCTKNIDVFKRPNGANNCDIFNCNGNVSDLPGFPSGHVATVSVFMHYIWFKYNDCKCLFLYPYYLIPIYIMSIARIEKKCHYPNQTFAGYILGVIISFIFKEIYIVS